MELTIDTFSNISSTHFGEKEKTYYSFLKSRNPAARNYAALSSPQDTGEFFPFLPNYDKNLEIPFPT